MTDVAAKNTLTEYNPFLLADFYKISHRAMYPQGTEYVYSTWIPRSTYIKGVKEVVAFGFQPFVQDFLCDYFNDNFFGKSKAVVIEDYKQVIKATLGIDDPDTQHLEDLHDLGYLPLEVKALPEGTLVPLRVPMLTIENTDPKFFWLTNALETLMSTQIWHPSTSATLAHEYRKVADKFALETTGTTAGVEFQCHDFSMRGMENVNAAAASGAGHLLSFVGTDTIPAILYAERYYGADMQTELIGTSIPATEHSVMCAYGQEEVKAFDRIISEVHPSGFVSVVSDTWDLWKVLTEVLPALHDNMARDGRVVIRPDSGDPTDIVCGTTPFTTSAKPLERFEPGKVSSVWRQAKGVVELLWDEFGGTINNQGYKVLDPHVGVIYGDSISLERQLAIFTRLQAKGFASSNIVFGVGSYCVAPNTPILCADLIWRPASDLEVGDEIVAFDEGRVKDQGKGHSRRYKTATITANNPAIKECARVITERGDEVVASEDHPWLVWLDNTRERGLVWKRTSDLVEGDMLAWFGEPWEIDQTRSGGWLAGIFDGEGSFAKQTGDRRIPAYRPNVVQNDGWVLDQILVELDRRGFDYNINKSKKARSVVLRGGWHNSLRFLGQIRPGRLMERLPEILANGPSLWNGRTFDLVAVKSIEGLGVQPVASITTSEGTFITNGYLTHNTYQYQTRDTFGFALKSTWVQINGQGHNIFKDPFTDTNKTKKSLTGRVAVIERDGVLTVLDGMDKTQQSCIPGDQLKTIFRNGFTYRFQTFKEIRQRLGHF